MSWNEIKRHLISHAGSSSVALKVLAKKVLIISLDQVKHMQPSTAPEYTAHN